MHRQYEESTWISSIRTGRDVCYHFLFSKRFQWSIVHLNGWLQTSPRVPVLIRFLTEVNIFPFLIGNLKKKHGCCYRLENEKSNEAQEAVRNLVVMVTSLCMCGYIDLKPSQASMGSLFQMPGFVLPQPSGRGTSVRNIQAFHVRFFPFFFLTYKIRRNTTKIKW